MSADVAVVVPAAGLGRRMGGVKKTFISLDGVPLLQRALDPFLARTDVLSVVVVLAPEDAAAPPRWLQENDARVAVVPGGDTRADSVRSGLDALPDEAAVVVVHDGARPLVRGDTIERCIGLARSGVGAVAGWRAVDTIKVADAQGRVVETPDRSRVWHAQTPQTFPRRMIETAYVAPNRSERATDDASFVEIAGHPVVMVESPWWNIKVTRKEDLELVEFIYRSRWT